MIHNQAGFSLRIKQYLNIRKPKEEKAWVLLIHTEKTANQVYQLFLIKTPQNQGKLFNKDYPPKVTENTTLHYKTLISF